MGHKGDPASGRAVAQVGRLLALDSLLTRLADPLGVMSRLLGLLDLLWLSGALLKAIRGSVAQNDSQLGASTRRARREPGAVRL
jgi:hypothetical protein